LTNKLVLSNHITSSNENQLFISDKISILEPLVSIVIPIFNRVELVSETLNSVLSQTYINWECLVIDDGSTDGTQHTINKFIEKDKRFRFIQRTHEPKGASVCRNIGIKNARGEYLIFLDSDDLLAEYCLEYRVKFVQNNPGYDFGVFKTALFVKQPGDTSSYWNILHKTQDDLYRFVVADIPWHTSGPLWSKNALQQLNGFNESAICWQDWEFHVRALLLGLTYKKQDESYHDTFYRNNLDIKNLTISGGHMELPHMEYRIHLFSNMLKNTLKTSNSELIRNAFAILFFKLIMEFYEIKSFAHIKTILKTTHFDYLFSPIERFLIFCLSIDFEIKGVNNFKNKLILKSLKVINKNKFFNSTNSSFLQ